MPPATTISTSPARISWSAIAIAFSPDRHTLLMVIDGMLIGRPRGDGRRAGGVLAGPGQDDLAHDHVVDLVAGDAGLLEGALDGDPAEVGGRESFSPPRRRPIGVRAPATMTDGPVLASWRETVTSRQNVTRRLAPRRGFDLTSRVIVSGSVCSTCEPASCRAERSSEPPAATFALWHYSRRSPGRAGSPSCSCSCGHSASKPASVMPSSCSSSAVSRWPCPRPAGPSRSHSCTCSQARRQTPGPLILDRHAGRRHRAQHRARGRGDHADLPNAPSARRVASSRVSLASARESG